jgi:hypothetical protein
LTPFGQQSRRGDASGTNELTKPFMSQTKRQLKAITTPHPQSIHEENQQRMQPLLSLAQVANTQELQRPFIDGIHPQLV